MGLEDFRWSRVMRCEGLGCPFKDKCERHILHTRDMERRDGAGEPVYSFRIIPRLSEKVCLDIVPVE